MNVPEKDPTFWEQMLYAWPVALAGLLVTGFGAAITWVVRNIFTNQKKLIKLETEITEREKAAQRGREDLRELKSDFKEMNTNLMVFFSNSKE